MGMISVAEIASSKGEKIIAEKLLQMSKTLLDNMLKYQCQDGRFHDILDDDTSFIDGTSAESMAAYIMMHAWKEKNK